MANKETKVLVTGASGFIGTHCVEVLLKNGYKVRGTVRDLKNKAKVQPVRQLDKRDLLELVEADLLDPLCWKNAIAGCDYVLHVASPFPIVSDEKCITTAVEGTLNVLRAIAENGNVKKLVLTSSCAAVNEGYKQDKVFDETSWSNLESDLVDSYIKSKTLAEKAAWDFIKELPDDKKFPMTVINPTLVFGPAYVTEQGASITLMRKFMNGEMPAAPPLNMAIVDVRDVALAHFEAMRRPESDNERILVTNSPSIWFIDIAKILREEFKGKGYWIPFFTAPYFFVRLYAIFDPETKASLPRLCHKVKFDNSKVQRLLGMTMRDNKEALIDMAHSLIDLGIIERK
uniref:Epimerase domain-containing protein n=1 Tax=Caenorhabditis japonica TaxID=281687 RepID=A0A8R1E1A9_CAEJA